MQNNSHFIVNEKGKTISFTVKLSAEYYNNT